jgi:hypothetical protein
VQEDLEVRMCHEFALIIHMFPLDFQDITTIVLALPAKTVAKVAPFAFQQTRSGSPGDTKLVYLF